MPQTQSARPAFCDGGPAGGRAHLPGGAQRRASTPCETRCTSAPFPEQVGAGRGDGGTDTGRGLGGGRGGPVRGQRHKHGPGCSWQEKNDDSLQIRISLIR